MVKCEVVFDENEIQCNGFLLQEQANGEYWFILNEDYEVVTTKSILEQAIKYCLENSDES
mgnify:CR=1 FL=1